MAPVRAVVCEWTGEAQGGCPWYAMLDPFVRRVLEAYAWFDKGQLATHAPNASKRLLDGVGYYHRAVSICQSKAGELARERVRRGNHR